ncbi:Rieske (2Fe-2S) protein [Dongshaea marina]|uniref:Rieske (2Fe-2S) protein n=1 Tax=Dongshaea marina TaxID=2047966 RepID=UPI000D3E0E8B|nr:Rieske 2Fe-2S domain-containing protein [Dongshaea marina]
MTLIGPIKDFAAQGIYPLLIDEIALLLVHTPNDYYVVENRCGHFGIPLDDGRVADEQIICSGHGIAFSLKTGKVMNRPYENCHPIKAYRVILKEGNIYFE